MLDESLILMIRERAIKLSTRLDVPCSGDLPTTASSDMIRLAEQSLGFCLHPEHRQILMSVANGGFGPAYGVLGVDDGQQPPNEFDLRIVEAHVMLCEMTVSDLAGLAPLCNWGAANWSLLGAQDGMVYIENEGNVYRSSLSFSEWMSAWVNGVNISDSMFIVEERTLPGSPIALKRIIGVKGDLVWRAPSVE